MMGKTTWSSGLNDFKKHTLIDNLFITEVHENDFEPNRSIDDIFYDHLANRQTSKVEVLFSGGADSELILKSCIKNKIPFEAITMAIQVKGITLNVIDLYYSEKFCRENDIKQKLIYLDAEWLFESGKYNEYLNPYLINEPHVASHFWLIEQCDYYPIFGGDWFWFQQHRNVLSPLRLDYACYERFMESKGIYGIGNMINHSFESCYKFIELHTQNEETIVPILKQKMYGFDFPRMRSYGWENIPTEILDIEKYKKNLIDIHKRTRNIIKWGSKIKKLINSDVDGNYKF